MSNIADKIVDKIIKRKMSIGDLGRESQRLWNKPFDALTKTQQDYIIYKTK